MMATPAIDERGGNFSCVSTPLDSPGDRQKIVPGGNCFKWRSDTNPTTVVEPVKDNRILAGAGFSYRDDDKVQCDRCGFELYKSTQLDVALQEHLRFKPDCPFIKRPESKRPPKHPEYREYAARLDSFTSWPGQYVPQTPENLATAGFYYIGSADRVTCFQCGITLRDWEEGHDPAVEHREYSPNCSFINEPDLNQLGVASRSILEDLQTDSVGVAGALDHHDLCVGSVGVSPAEDRSDECIATDADTDAVKTVKDMGFSTVDINKAREMIKQRIGRDFENIFELVEYLLELETTISNTEHKMSQKSSSHTISISQSTFTDSSHTSLQSDIPREFHQSTTSKTKMTPLLAENRRLRDKKTCRVCRHQDVCVLFLPCAHLVTCGACADRVSDCVVCNKAILGTVKTYLS